MQNRLTVQLWFATEIQWFLLLLLHQTEAKEDQDFFPLQVEYREKTSAAGKFPGGYIKREGRPTEKEISKLKIN